MKKLFLLLSLSLFFSVGHSQIMMDAASGTVTATYDAGVPIKTMGSIIVQVSSNYNGTTDTLQLYVGTMGKSGVIIWTKAYQPDGVTLAKFTLTSGANTSPVVFLIHRSEFVYYRLAYYKGDCTAGTVTSVLSTKQN